MNNRRNDSRKPKSKSKPSAAPSSFRDRSGKEHPIRGGNKPAISGGSGKSPIKPQSSGARVIAPQRSDSKKGRPRPMSKGAPAFAPKGRGQRNDQRRGPERGNQKSFRPNKTGGAFKAKATIDKNQKGFGFLIFDRDDLEDAYLPASEAARFFHGDRVEVSAASNGEIQQVEFVAHRFRELVGRYSPSLDRAQKRSGTLIYERKRVREEVLLLDPPADIKPGDWIRAELQFVASPRGDAPTVTGKVLQVYGAELPASSDIQVLAAEYNLIEEHPPKAVQEAESFTLEIPGKDMEGRTDLRHLPFITIDGETARDFDDAIYVEREGKNFVLWVAIADVSHYVKEGTALDKDAHGRGTSVYFPERAFHMLPRALSEELCSLKPKVPRLAMVAKMKFNPNGKRESTELFEGVIESRRRATYTEIETEYLVRGKDKSWDLAPQYELYKIIRRTRDARGSIDFDLPEMEVLVKPDGEPIDIRKRERLEAHRLIEEFMVAANEAVTEWILERKWPFVFRVHGEPSGEALERFLRIAKTVGFNVNIDLEDVSPRVLSEVAKGMKGHTASLLLNSSLLRAMKQAAYSAVHDIHFGLASKAYTHFTSPIRRYPDLVVHRLLRRALRAEKDQKYKLGIGEREKLQNELDEVTEHCSHRERLATDAERESMKVKQVRLMKTRLGDDFDALIVGMMERGMFAQVQAPFVEGMIAKESILDDLYEFNEDRMVFYGKRKKRTFRVGDRVRIQVVRADLERRQVDFALIDSVKPT